jgi:hypothetical protein
LSNMEDLRTSFPSGRSRGRVATLVARSSRVAVIVTIMKYSLFAKRAWDRVRRELNINDTPL